MEAVLIYEKKQKMHLMHMKKNKMYELIEYDFDKQNMENETDADGWTVVRRRTRVEEEEMLTAIQMREKKKREEMQKKDFYK